jgi:glutamine synthetase
MESAEKQLVEYVWIDAYGELRSKIKVVDTAIETLKDVPSWDFDGTLTRSLSGTNPEVILQPVALYANPFIPGHLVLCSNYLLNNGMNICPYINNTRHLLLQEKLSESKIAYAFQQEYYILNRNDQQPYHNALQESNKYYCGTQNGIVDGRTIAEAHLMACLKAGLMISGFQAREGPSQWAYGIGPGTGLAVSDELWLSRYILLRIADKFAATISLQPKPFPTLAGSHCSIKISTPNMRDEGGFELIKKVIPKLREDHDEYVKVCGDNSKARLTSESENMSLSSFSWGVGTTNTCIQIPKKFQIANKGYIKDCRPSGNMDPYKVIRELVLTLKSDVENI